MLHNPFRYLWHALQLAYSGIDEIKAFLQKTDTIEDLIKFCNNACTAPQPLLFIIDQVNALDPIDESKDRFANETKALARRVLDNITAEHLKVSSSTGNYIHAIHDTHRQAHEKRRSLYGGLTKVLPLNNNYLREPQDLILCSRK